MLGDRVDERVARARVLDKEATDARGERPEVADRVEVAGEGDEDDCDGYGDLEKDHHGLLQVEVMLAALPRGNLEDLVADEDEERGQLLHRLQRVHADGRHTHRADCADDEEEGVGAMHRARVAATDDERSSVHTNHVEDEDEATPCHHHVYVREAAERSENDRRLCGHTRSGRRGIGTERTHPAVEGCAHGGHRDALIVISTADRAHDVAGNYRHDQRGEGTGTARAGAL
mmetsp:Transcript_27728/g.55789  ORF Transcript_27728/g.55789 Transcript_27728/m.55789 type:complete len:231 (-) Transcript_27728:464-1156(-)